MNDRNFVMVCDKQKFALRSTKFDLILDGVTVAQVNDGETQQFMISPEEHTLSIYAGKIEICTSVIPAGEFDCECALKYEPLSITRMIAWRLYNNWDIQKSFSPQSKILDGKHADFIKKSPILTSIAQTMDNKKESDRRDKEYVSNNPGAKAICEFMISLFDKGNGGYQWCKDNHTGLRPIVTETAIELSYWQTGDGKSLSGVMPKYITVMRFSLRDIYEWYGDVDDDCLKLTNKIRRNHLEYMIYTSVESALTHISYDPTLGFRVKRFK